MFRIGEFSKMVRVSARMLRHYEKCGLLCPADTDRFTRYRLYSAKQMPILYKIVQLRDMGFGVDEIKAALPNYNNIEFMREMLKKKSLEIQSNITEEQNKLKKIAIMSGLLEKERVNMVFDVELKALTSVKVLSLRETIPSYDKEEMLWGKLGRFVSENNVVNKCVGGYSIYHDEDHKESDVDVEIAIPVEEFGKNQGEFVFKELEAIPSAAVIRFSGPYEGYSEAITKLATWTEQNGYVFDGLIRGLAIASPTDVSSPDDYMTELQVSVKKAS